MQIDNINMVDNVDKPLIPTIPYELLSLIIGYSINNEMKQIENEVITTSLQTKLGKTTLDMLFNTDEDIIINNKLVNKEIYLLAKLFVMNIDNIKENNIYDISKNILFSLNFVKEALLNLTKKLILGTDKELNQNSDDNLDFQLNFIFICNEFIKINRDIYLVLYRINFKIFVNSFNTIIHILKLNTKLVSLYLSANNIGIDGTIEIATALKTNTTLTTLILILNKIGDEGVKALAEALKTNRTLTTLDIYYNRIGNLGAYALALALKTNKTLTKLNLQHNRVGDLGAYVIAQALKENEILKTLNLQNNSINQIDATVFVQALEINKTIRTIDLRNNFNIYNKDIFKTYLPRLMI